MKLTEREIKDLENRIPDLAKEAGREAYERTLEFNKLNSPVKAAFDSKSNFLNYSATNSEFDVVKVLFTNDKDLLIKYDALRRRCLIEVNERYKTIYPERCKESLNYDSFNINDEVGQQLLVVVDKDKNVVGGARLFLENKIFNTSDIDNSFAIKNLVERYNFNHEKKYSLLDNFVVDRSFRDGGVAKEMLLALIEESKKNDCTYLLCFATISSARNTRIITKSLGYDCDVFSEHHWIRKENVGYETRYPVVIHLK